MIDWLLQMLGFKVRPVYTVELVCWDGLADDETASLTTATTYSMAEAQCVAAMLDLDYGYTPGVFVQVRKAA